MKINQVCSLNTSTSTFRFSAFCCTRFCSDVIDFHFVYSTEKCDSPLGLSLPDNRWSASSTSDGRTFAAHFGRLNNSPDTVGWCSSTAKEEKAFIEVTASFIVLFVPNVKIDLVTPPRGQTNQGPNSQKRLTLGCRRRDTKVLEEVNLTFFFVRDF